MKQAPVYVLSVKGKPLYPTRRFGHVRRLLKQGRAQIINYKPFQIQLLYEEVELYQTPDKKKIQLGIDPGRTNIGLSAINLDGDILYSAHLTTRNKEIAELMADRKYYRQSRRRYQRQKKIRRAIKCNTIKEFQNGRLLPGCKEPVFPKYIINSEARFLNRKRSSDWITPSVKQLVQTHLSVVRKIADLLPIDSIVFELNKFAFMQLEDGTCQGIDFQNGRLKGFVNKYDYIDNRQNGLCCLCKKNKIEHYHHLLHRKDNGSDLPENLIGVCEACHKKIHLGKLTTKMKGIKKKYHHLSVLNQAIPFIIKELKKLGFPMFLTTGKLTYDYRIKHQIPKEHHFDATCIVGSVFGIENIDIDCKSFEIVQFRNHNRKIIQRSTERRYYLNGEHVATNRKDRCEQKGDSLATWYQKQRDLFGIAIANKLRSQLSVKKSSRAYNDLNRYLAATIFEYKGKIYIQRKINAKKYFVAFGSEKNFPIKDCKILAQNLSLVYL